MPSKSCLSLAACPELCGRVSLQGKHPDPTKLTQRAQCVRTYSLGLVPDNHLSIQDALVVLQLFLNYSIHDCKA